MVLLGLLLLTMSANGESKFAYPPQRFSLRGVREIHIVGVKGRLSLHGRKGARLMTLRVRQSSSARADDWNLSLDRRGHTLYLEVANVTYGKAWQRQIQRDQWPEFDIELDGPSRPTTVSWREGRLEFARWDANLDVSFLKGEAHVQGGRGALHLQAVEARVDVRDRNGSVDVRGESGTLSLARLNGDVQANWWRGELALRECRGQTTLEAREAQVRVQGGQGSLDLSLPAGQAEVVGFVGQVNARGEKSRWNVAASAPSEVNITSASGPVGLTWSGGAKVFLSSQKGSIAAPKRLLATLVDSDEDGPRVLRGIKPGSVRGQVFVRTASGPIRWR